MANKLNQINIGDMLYIQLDNNPRDTGYQAPMGSSAVYIDTVNNIGRFFHKEGAGPNAWREIRPWNVFGNQESNHRLFGTLTNFDITYIRNNIEYMKAIENTDPDMKDVTLSLFQNNLVMMDIETSKGYDSFGKIVVMNQSMTTRTALESDRYSVGIQSYGFIGRSSDLGFFDECHDVVGLNDIYVKKLSRGKAVRTATPVLNKISITAYNMNLGNPEMFTVEVNAIIKRDSDGLIVDLKRKFAVDCTNFSNQVFSTLDKQAVSSYYGFGSSTVDIDMRFENTSDLYVAEPLNTLNLVLDFIGLDNAQTYSIVEWVEITVLER